MKKSLLALAMLSAIASIAQAQSVAEEPAHHSTATAPEHGASGQSSVTIFGIVDVGIAHERGGSAGSVTRMGSGILSGSRLGFKGTEDLGGGLSAKFHIEQGILADTGASDQGGLAFGRQSWVGLSGNFGSVTLGRQWNTHFLALDAVDPFDYSLAGAANNIISGPFRTNNAIKYESPKVGGFSGEVSYGFGEIAGNNRANRTIALSASYMNGPIMVILAHNRAEDPSPAFDNPVKNTALAGSYDFGPAKLGLIYNVNKNNATIDNNDMLVGVTVPFGASTFLASYIRKNDKTVANLDANQIAIGYIYALSKRTSFYSSYARISNKNGAKFTVGDSTESGSGDKAFNVGIRHTF